MHNLKQKKKQYIFYPWSRVLKYLNTVGHKTYIRHTCSLLIIEDKKEGKKEIFMRYILFCKNPEYIKSLDYIFELNRLRNNVCLSTVEPRKFGPR